MSCDNIQGNGNVAKRMFSAYARARSAELGDWLAAEVAFPNAMVDRITPVTAPTDIEELSQRFGVEDAWPVVCEPFTQWVLEDHFPLGRPAFEKVGVQVVEDVEPYELMKLRLLNASHQALTYFGYLAGYRYAHEVCQDPLFVEFLLGYMREEGTPTLAPVPGGGSRNLSADADRALCKPANQRHLGAAVRRKLGSHSQMVSASDSPAACPGR